MKAVAGLIFFIETNMNLLFQRQHTYQVEKSPEQVETRLKFIVTRRWDDHSMDVIGSLSRDGNFRLTHKWGLTNLKWIDNRPAYIRGKIDREENRTHIKITTRPNKLFVVFFYLALGILTVEALGLENVINLPKSYKIGLPVGLCVIFLSLIILYSTQLKRRFESLMHLMI